MSSNLPRWIVRLGCVALVSIGIAKLAVATGRMEKDPASNIDFWYSYAAGLTWRQGLNPYDADQYFRVSPTPLHCTYAYAPTSSIWVIPFSFLPIRTAQIVLRLINMAATFGIALMLWIIVRRALVARPGPPWAQIAPAAVSTLVLISPVVSVNLLLGQTSTLAAAILCAAWWFHEANRPIATGVLVAAATFKPSIAVFIVPLVLLTRNRSMIVAMVVAGLVMAAWPLLQNGPIQIARTWREAMHAYSEYPQNQMADPGGYGLGAILADLGVNPSLSIPLALVGFLWSLWRRETLGSLGLFATALAWPVLLIRAHGYDSVALLPMLAFAVILAAHRPRIKSSLALVFTLALLAMLPRGLAEGFTSLGIPLPHRLHELAAIGLMLWIIILIEIDARRFKDVAPDTLSTAGVGRAL